MNLAQAVEAVKAGKTVTRADPEWTSRGLTWGPAGLNNPKLDMRAGETVINEQGVAISPVMLFGEDVFAEDWEVVE